MASFSAHPNIQSLNGVWDFEYLGDASPESFAPDLIRFTDRLSVPSAFDASPGFEGKRGLAAYRREISIPAGRPGRLYFDAVSIWTRIYLDGIPQMEHACGYAPFFVDIPPSSHEARELVVLVDNRFDFKRAPMHEPYFDFYQYGGIHRDVSLRIFPRNGGYLHRIEVAPSPSNYRQGEILVSVHLREVHSRSVTITTQIDHAAPQEHLLPLFEDGCVKLKLTVPNAKLWSPESPHLHTLHISLDNQDELETRFGLRRIESRNGVLYLNDDPLQLRGYNRHEWHPCVGPATSPQLMALDLRYLKEMGCNFVRGSHYPQNQRFLDLCDELGMLVWEETLGWQQHAHSLNDPVYRAHHAEAIQAMVHASYNHPSVVIWGFLNEADTDLECSDLIFQDTVAQLRKLDSTRLISYASHRPDHDRHFALVDIISVNIYPGWYDCIGVDDPLALIKPYIKRLADLINSRGYCDKPLVISEIGAEAIYGFHDLHRDFFTEEYQSELLCTAVQAVLESERYAGIALWQFSDTRTVGGGGSLSRPRTFNNKGTFDEYRRPKLAYSRVGELFRFFRDVEQARHSQPDQDAAAMELPHTNGATRMNLRELELPIGVQPGHASRKSNMDDYPVGGACAFKTQKMRDRSRNSAFSLVEVVLALGIVSFGLISLMGLLTVGLKTFHEALNTTTEAEIAQQLSNQLQLADFSRISTQEATIYYFTAEGLATNANNAVYSATVSPPTKLAMPGAGQNPSGNTLSFVISITSKNAPQITNAVPIQIADNGT